MATLPMPYHRPPSLLSASSSHAPPQPLRQPDLFPLLNSLRDDPAFAAALEQQQQSEGKRGKLGRKTSQCKESTSTPKPQRGRDARNDLLVELYGFRPGELVDAAVARSEVGSRQRAGGGGQSAAARFAASTGWEGSMSLPGSIGVASAEMGKIPQATDLFRMLDNPPGQSTRPSPGHTINASSSQSVRRPLPRTPAQRSLPNLGSSLLPSRRDLFHSSSTASYPIHSPLPIAPRPPHSSSLGPGTGPPRAPSAFAHAGNSLQRIMSRASNRTSSIRSRSNRMSGGGDSSTFSRARSRTISDVGSTSSLGLVASPIADPTYFSDPTGPPQTTSPTSISTHETTSRLSLAVSNSTRPRPRTLFAREDVTLSDTRGGEVEARRAFIELLKEGPPSPAPPLRTRRSLPDPSLAAAEVDEPRYWIFDRMMGEEGEGDKEAKPRPREMSPKERSTSGYWSYGSRWDLDEFDVRFEGGEGERKGKRKVWKVWRGWAREKREGKR